MFVQQFRRLFDYEFRGLKHLDKARPSILVGNHSIYSYDVAILLVELKLLKDIEQDSRPPVQGKKQIESTLARR